MKRIILLLLVFMVGAIMLYLSRFWFLELWPRSGLLGWEALRPGGGLLGRWLRGTAFAPFELLIWICGVFMVLTYLQRAVDFALTKFASRTEENPNV